MVINRMKERFGKVEAGSGGQIYMVMEGELTLGVEYTIYRYGITELYN